MKHYFQDKPFYVQTDASDRGICGILFQKDKNKRIISLVSRTLTQCELHYTTTEKELLYSITYAINKFRTYLFGVRFYVVTDHKALVFLLSTSYYSSRLTRWSLLLQQYDFNILYCAGAENVVADYFSRYFINDVEVKQNELAILGIHEIVSKKENKIRYLFAEKSISKEIRGIAEMQKADTCTEKIRERIIQNKKLENFILYENVLFQKAKKQKGWRIVIPKKFAQTLIRTIHVEYGHIGIYKTSKYLHQFYYWKRMNKDIRNIIRYCDHCQCVKYNNVNMEGPHQSIIPNSPNEMISIDFYGPLPQSRGGVQYLLVVIDIFSKYVALYPIKKATIKITINKIVNDYFVKVGKAKVILSDNGTQFTSKKWKQILEKENVRVIFSSIRHPQSNPVERIMRELGRFFRTFCAEQHTNWASYVKQIENILNITTHSSTGYTPYEVQFEISPQFKIKQLVRFPSQGKDDIKLHIKVKENLMQNAKTRNAQQKTLQSSIRSR